MKKEAYFKLMGLNKQEGFIGPITGGALGMYYGDRAAHYFHDDKKKKPSKLLRALHMLAGGALGGIIGTRIQDTLQKDNNGK